MATAEPARDTQFGPIADERPKLRLFRVMVDGDAETPGPASLRLWR